MAQQAQPNTYQPNHQQPNSQHHFTTGDISGNNVQTTAVGTMIIDKRRRGARGGKSNQYSAQYPPLPPTLPQSQYSAQYPRLYLPNTSQHSSTQHRPVTAVQYIPRQVVPRPVIIQSYGNDGLPVLPNAIPNAQHQHPNPMYHDRLRQTGQIQHMGQPNQPLNVSYQAQQRLNAQMANPMPNHHIIESRRQQQMGMGQMDHIQRQMGDLMRQMGMIQSQITHLMRIDRNDSNEGQD
eukprot:28978_1